MDKRLLIAKPIASELDTFNSLYKDSIKSNNPRIQEIINYSFKSDGKKIRPILLLLAAKACGEINQTTYSSAITIELLHTASLIHDDVVDESLLRRGKPSMNAVYDNKIAVLAGDYFLSTALTKSIYTGNIDIVSDIATLGRNLAEGELNQLSLAKEIILDEKQYFEVIKKKTASLLSVGMKIGAISVNGDETKVKVFKELGEVLGICFQLKDDTFDYFTNDIGKPTGNDIREGKITLPLLYALKNSNEAQVKSILDIINKADFTDENVTKLTDFAKENGGIEYVKSKIEIYKKIASQLISTIENEKVKEALFEALDYIINRNY